jgi:prevent-host-death family protein
MTEHRSEWTVSTAQTRFDDIVERALVEGPQTVSRGGRPVVVVVSFETWERRAARRGNLAEFVAASPLKGSGIELERLPDGPRAIDR